MTRLGKLLTHAAVAAVIGGAALVASAPAASARVVCNYTGDCWSTNQRYQYPADVRVRFYNDRYTNGHYRNRHWRNHHRNWRDAHHDRGYYREGLWVTF